MFIPAFYSCPPRVQHVVDVPQRLVRRVEVARGGREVARLLHVRDVLGAATTHYLYGVSF